MDMPKTSPEIGGMGHSVKRKEDARFIRGKGNYVDDVRLPGRGAESRCNREPRRRNPG